MYGGIGIQKDLEGGGYIPLLAFFGKKVFRKPRKISG
jgi:hypothetical protein